MILSKIEGSIKSEYKDQIAFWASFSRLFSESDIPFLHYRLTERLFCNCFNAEDVSRCDNSVDSIIDIGKEKIGVGIKTFVHNTGDGSFQKIAEFNRMRTEITDEDPSTFACNISKARNARIRTTINQYGLNKCFYNLIVRSANYISVFEEPMVTVDLSSLEILEDNRSTLSFKDSENNYKFNKSKSTLYKQFFYNLDKAELKADVNILEDPFELLYQTLRKEALEPIKMKTDENFDTLYLPLYSTRSPNPNHSPSPGSGLNQWNALGRKRDPDEVYIPVPAEIHRRFPDFFPKDRSETFDLELPDGKVLSAKMCQENRKGLMSNPNKDLGKWLLRDVLALQEGTLVTRKILDEAGVDSVEVRKIAPNFYKIDICGLGKYEDFINPVVR